MVCGEATFFPGGEVEEEEDNTTTHPHMDQAVNPRHTIPIQTTTTTHPKCHKWIPGVSLHQTLQQGHLRLNRWAPLLPNWAPQLPKCTPLSISRSPLTWAADGYPLISLTCSTQVWEEAMAASSFR